MEVEHLSGRQDFVALAPKLGLVETGYKRILKNFVAQKDAVLSLIDRSNLPDDAKKLYAAHVQDSVQALLYSCDSP